VVRAAAQDGDLLTIAAFVGSILLFRFVPQQFFPASGRPELMVDLKLAEGASLANTAERVKRWRRCSSSRTASTTTWPMSAPVRRASTCRWTSNCRRQLRPVRGAGQVDGRPRAPAQLADRTLDQQFPDLRSRVTRLENGPPVGYPVQFRSPASTSRRSVPWPEVAAKVRENPHVVNVHLDWEEPSKVVYLNIDQDRARALGVSTAHLASSCRVR
jgi:multidrug efflux pump